MGSFAFITINDYVVSSSRNYFNEWFFKKSDRKIVTQKLSQRNTMMWGEPGPDAKNKTEQCYIYEISAGKLKRRLELAGWSCHCAKQEFIRSVSDRLLAAEEYGHSDFRDYRHHVPILKAAVFEEWLAKLERIISSKTRRTYEWEEPNRNPDTILEILLNMPDYQSYNDDISAFDINWPCVTFEGFIRAILEVVPGDAPCILDISDLLHGGWTEEFTDLIEYQREYTIFYDIFDTAIGDIKQLTSLDKDNQILSRLLFANTITTMETYLFETLKKQIITRPALLRRFVENQAHFQKEKITVSELFKKMDTITEAVIEVIDKMTFHNLPTTIAVYKTVMDVNFPKSAISQLSKAIELRHDIIHRNGKQISGKTVIVKDNDVESLIQLVTEVIRDIDKQVKDGLLDDIDVSDD
jgi:hypothetical protein